jgi:3-methyladenine DNA glycosylase AlkD
MADREKARILQGFFKTGPGEYGAGDVFLGVTVPPLRRLSRQGDRLCLRDILLLLRSPVHEERLLALLILTRRFQTGDDTEQERIHHLYLANTRFINNWDLVDLTAPNIVGAFLLRRSRRPLHALARSADLWERRIAMVATHRFIRENDFADAFRVARILRADSHDLIHKAVGWMLREIGKRDLAAEERFLRPLYRTLPRTMLRYAIERFPEPKRQRYLKGRV